MNNKRSYNDLKLDKDFITDIHSQVHQLAKSYTYMYVLYTTKMADIIENVEDGGYNKKSGESRMHASLYF